MSDKVKLIPFDVEHFKALDLADSPGQGVFVNMPNHLSLLSIAAKHPSCTLMEGDRPVACVGIVILWPGVAEGWAFVSQTVTRHRIAFLRHLILGLRKAELSHKLHRVQAVVNKDYAEGKRLVHYLGFFAEGTLYGYGADDSDYVMYARRIG